MKDLKIKLGMRIKYLRKAKNLTQEQLAEKINIINKLIYESIKLKQNILCFSKNTKKF